MAETIFYTEVDPKVNSVIETRKAIAAATLRSSQAHKWLYEKMAYADASAVLKDFDGKVMRTANLELPTKGGLNGLYTKSQDGRYPVPHLDSVKISSDGDWGSLKKCEMSFTVYTRNDLDKKQPFFDIGALLTVNYGWNASGGAGGNPGQFAGTIYNFTYSVSPDGSFKCVTYAVGPGIAVLAAEANASAKTASDISDKLNNVTLDNNLTGKIKQLVANAQKSGLKHDSVNSDGIGVINYGTSWASSEGSAQADKNQKETDIAHYYITLGKLINIINEIFSDNVNPAKLKNGNIEVKFICNSDYTRGVMPKTNENLVSANPNQIMFPGFGNYGDKHNFKFAPYNGDFTAGDLSKILINVDFIYKTLSDIGTVTEKNQKSADSSTGSFLRTIFNSILKNSGTRFKLSAVSNPKNNQELLIIDTNYYDGNSIKPCILSAVTRDSICRGISLTSKVPAEFATAAFVSSRSTLSSQITLGAPGTTTNKESQQAPSEQLKNAKKNLDAQGLTASNINSLQSSLQSVYTLGVDPKTSKELIPFPLDFSATIDGLEGFVFGNVITTNYLPILYSTTNPPIAFTVTKVDHTISNNDWTTTLSTVCRILYGS